MILSWQPLPFLLSLLIGLTVLLPGVLPFPGRAGRAALACLLTGALLSAHLTALTVNPMLSDMLRLMLLAELLPRWLTHDLRPRLRRWHPDPWTAAALRAAVVLLWSLPDAWTGDLARHALPLLPFLYLGTGLLAWQAVRSAPHARTGLLMDAPMLLAGSVLLLLPAALPVHAAGAGLPCVWGFTPLDAQRSMGAVMLLTCLPSLARHVRSARVLRSARLRAGVREAA